MDSKCFFLMASLTNVAPLSFPGQLCVDADLIVAWLVQIKWVSKELLQAENHC